MTRNQLLLLEGLAALALVAFLIYGLLVPPGPAEAPAAPQAAESGEPGETAPSPGPTADPAPAAEPVAAVQPAGPAQSWSVYGAITAAGTGNPIPNARVELLPAGPGSGEGAPVARGNTDNNGAYEVTGEAAGDVWVRCTAPGFASQQVRLNAPEGTSRRQDFQLEPGAAVRGRVADRDSSAPIEGVRVRAVDAQLSLMELQVAARRAQRGLWAETGVDGQYQIEGIGPGSYRIFVEAADAGYVFSADQAPSIAITGGADIEGIDFALEQGATAEGIVRDAAGQPIEAAKVQLVPADVLQASWEGLEQANLLTFADRSATTGANGAYTLAGLAWDTPYRLRVEADRHALLVSEVFQIARGASPHTLDFSLTEGSRITGLAKFENGEPAANIRVSLMPEMSELLKGVGDGQQDTTGVDGSFSFRHVPAGRYVLAAGRSAMPGPFAPQAGREPVTVDGKAAIENLELTVPDAAAPGTGVIEGIVEDTNGQPVANAAVRAVQPGTLFGPLARATTGEDGTFTIEKLADATYTIEAQAPQGRAEQANVAVNSYVRIRLEKTARVRGMVVRQDGSAVPGAAVTLRPQGKQESGGEGIRALMRELTGRDEAARTDDFGFFEFSGTEPGTYVVHAKTNADGVGTSAALTVTVGADINNVRVVLEPGAPFDGIVRNARGEPVEGVQVQLAPAEGAAGFMASFMPSGLTSGGYRASSANDGRFSIASVAPGRYRLTATHPNFAKAVQDGIEIQSGRAVVNHTVVMTPGGTARGRFTVNGEARAGVMVQLIGPAGMTMATTDAEGRFEVGSLAPGSYMVQAVDMSALASGDIRQLMNTQTQVVEIGDGGATDIEFGPGAGPAVSGQIGGADLGNVTQITLRRPGSMAPEDINPMSMSFAQMLEAARAVEGQAMANEDGSFRLEGVEPGTYILEVYSFDLDMANPDFEALMNMDRSPRFRQEVTVGSDAVNLNIDVPARAQ